MFEVTEMYAGSLAPLGSKRLPSGILKSAVSPPWVITELGLVGDAQGDPVHHGGREKAIHHYPTAHYAAWLGECPDLADVLACPPAFGENVGISGMAEETVHIGDVYRLGSALLQVSQGRQPCWKLNVRLGRKDLAYRMQANGRTGWYYRVLEPGDAMPGDLLTLVDRPVSDVPLSRLISVVFSRTMDADELVCMTQIAQLSPSWRKLLQRRLETNAT
jgi:MOSC domain-containing protein YiiM